MRGRGRDCSRLVLMSRDGDRMYWNGFFWGGGLIRYRVREAVYYSMYMYFRRAISWVFLGWIDSSTIVLTFFFFFHFYPEEIRAPITSWNGMEEVVYSLRLLVLLGEKSLAKQRKFYPAKAGCRRLRSCCPCYSRPVQRSPAAAAAAGESCWLSVHWLFIIITCTDRYRIHGHEFGGFLKV